MGVKGVIGTEAASYVHKKHGGEINTLLERIGTILFDCEIEPELATEIAAHIAEIAGINFIAGIQFCNERPGVAQELKRTKSEAV